MNVKFEPILRGLKSDIFKGGGVGRLMANAILNFHFDYWHTSLSAKHVFIVRE